VDPSQQELLDEMLSFPVGKHDDLLDAAAFGTAFLLDTPEPRVF
jgi:phage terminase large subunit-like protein